MENEESLQTVGTTLATTIKTDEHPVCRAGVCILGGALLCSGIAWVSRKVRAARLAKNKEPKVKNNSEEVCGSKNK